MDRIITVSSVVEWARFGTHGAKIVVVQNPPRESIAVLTLRYYDKDFLFTGGCVCDTSTDTWDSEFGAYLSSVRVCEKAAPVLTAWGKERRACIAKEAEERKQAPATGFSPNPAAALKYCTMVLTTPPYSVLGLPRDALLCKFFDELPT